MPDFKYAAQRFRQRADGPETVLFIAPAEEIITWGGVPQKSSRFMKGFQRADTPTHWQEIADYFETPGNISPTAIVVAFKPGRAHVEDNGAMVEVTIDFRDLSNLPISELAERVSAELNAYDEDGENADVDSESDEPDDVDDADDEPEDLDFGAEALKVQQSHLSQFLAFLRDPAALERAREEDEGKLRDMLINLLRPATIVDGQHRTRGAAFLEQGISFPVVGLVDADWREQVFQFVVINQRAKPIPAQFLSAIISSSLSSVDIQQMSARLEQAGVDLGNTKIMDLVHLDARSPFRGMIDFKVQGSTGKMPYPGILALARRFRGLRTHDREVRFPDFFKTVFRDGVPGQKYSDQRTAWNEIVWFGYFASFWNVVRDHVCDASGGYEHLWSHGSNLMKIVTLQELQNLFLQWLSDRRDPVKDENEIRQQASHFLTNLKPIFFEKEWKLPSLQSGTGRQYLRKALSAALKKPRFDYKVPLFTGVRESKS